jgi:dihydrofolate synthase/folylpolyglutamate synthase
LKESGFQIPEKDIHTGLRKVKKLTGFHGRWELIHEQPAVILDVGHNEDGMKQIVQQLELTDHHELHIILGMVKDKEVEKVLSLLPHQAHYYFTRAQIPRAFNAEILKQIAEQLNLKGEVFPDVNMALKNAFEKAGKEDLILICGSVFLVGEVTVPVK